MSNTNELKIIDLNASTFVSKEDIGNDIASVNYDKIKENNYDNLMTAIGDATAKRIIINIPNETFSFSNTIAVTGADYIKIVNNGVIEADPVPLPKTEDNNMGTSTPETGDNGTENTQSEEGNNGAENASSETGNTGTETQNPNEENTSEPPKPVQMPVFEFKNCKEVYYEGRGVSEDTTVNKDSIRSSHADAEVNFAPEHHTRKNLITSMRTGISVTCCEKVEIKNATFSGLEYAVLLMTAGNDSYENCNGDVTISNIRVTDTSQPIFVADTRNVTIENADMCSRENVGRGEHFVYCSRFVDNVFIRDCTFDYSDEHFGCAINLCNSAENADTLNGFVKFCRIDNVVVDKMYRPFVSAKADTRLICNNCEVTTRDTIVANNDVMTVFSLAERVHIDIINCTVEDKLHQYIFADLRDDVQVNVSGGEFTGLYMVGVLGDTAGNEMNSINLNVSSAEIETHQPYIRVYSKTKAYFYANFNNCKLFTHAGFYFRSDTENCRIACYNCGFKYIKPNDSPIDRIPIAYHAITIPPTNPEDKPSEESRSLLDNIKVINCTGDGTKGVAHFGQEGKSTAYGNYFSYTEDGVPRINSTCVHKNSITLNKLSYELQEVIAPLLTTS